MRRLFGTILGGDLGVFCAFASTGQQAPFHATQIPGHRNKAKMVSEGRYSELEEACGGV